MKSLMRTLLLVTVSLGVVSAAVVPKDKKIETKTTSDKLFRLGTKFDPESLILGKSGDRCGEAWITIESNQDTVVLHWNVEYCQQDQEPDEVVIFDVHHLPVGFYSNNSPNLEAHAALTEMLQAELGPHISNRMSIDNRLTIKSLVDKNTRAVVSYVDGSIQNQHNWLWPSVRHLWANTNNAQQMLNFLDNELSSRHTNWNSAMCQTTPTALDILMGRGSIRGNAEDVSKPVDDRLRSSWARNINIVSPDFFMGSNIVSHCLRINLERSYARKLDSSLQTKDD